MITRRFLIFIIILILPIMLFAETIKKADLAGSWYPSSKKTLSSILDSYLNVAEVKHRGDRIKAIIVPHAGFAYSGPVAAYAYKAVQDKEYSTVLVLGFCHRKSFDGISVYKEGYFDTPLGALEVDSEMANEIISYNEKIIFKPDAFENENSIELELPFIKKVLPHSKIVPIAFGSRSFDDCKLLSEVLGKILSKREDVLLVVSTDMSHYRTYEDARKIDLKSIELLKSFQARKVYETSVASEQIFCGYMPVTTLLLTCNKIGLDNLEVLQYANSGDVTGDRKRVVGYLSALVTTREPDKKGDEMLTDAQRKKLLKIARDTIKTHLETGNVLEVKETDSIFNKELGAFVTLHKRGQLRGCIGNIIGRGPLYLTVRDMAIQSATGDPRFPKVTLQELNEIDIEVSVLSELEKVGDVEKIEMGVHGVIIRKGFSSGVFLPQVATETGWSREEFMTNLCVHKAGLLPDAWKTGEADIFTFTAEVFGEKDE